ncbi:hypothetical protein SDC9_106321 [bioreactor metagenome]|uniref:Uncharacterized protein n=1 Tax=bioreactor metagenome TaxID=1076179 RepID=A0A645B249_9ZZZZ
MRHLLGRQARLLDGVFQCDVRVRRRVAHETQLLAVNALFQIDLGNARHLTAQAQLDKLRHGLDARAARAQRSLHRFKVIADARDDARTRDHHALFHAAAPWPLPSRINRPTRRSLAT